MDFAWRLRSGVERGEISLLDTRISPPDKPRAAGEALHEIEAAVKSASGQPIDYGCCVGQDPHEPRYSVHANNEPAREVMTRLLDSMATAATEPG